MLNLVNVKWQEFIQINDKRHLIRGVFSLCKPTLSLPCQGGKTKSESPPDKGDLGGLLKIFLSSNYDL